MARIFKQCYTTNRKGRKTKRQTRKWYVEYRDAQGIRRRVAGYTDKAATQQLEAELERRGVQWTLFAPGNRVVEFLDNSSAWLRLYADDHAVVHIRRDQPRI